MIHNVPLSIGDFTSPLDMTPQRVTQRCHPLQDLIPFKIDESQQQGAPKVKLDEANLDVIDHLQRILESQQEEAAQRRHDKHEAEQAEPEKIKFHIVG